MSDRETVIKIRDLSKLYRLGQVGSGSMRDDLNRWWAKLRGKQDPFMQAGQTNQRDQQGKSDYVWALQNLNLDVKRGEVLGIIGGNGSGKSTLLKLISRITTPTRGSIRAKGRISSLLEVGTGMHPDMTARENIYLNGAILGMKRREIARKFDDIIDFAGCQLYIDTPVKRYSSGMHVRLGFAVAAFLEPEILIVDEVLAVGDADFQRRATGKIQEVTRSGTRTVLFVSHNFGLVNSICSSVVWMSQGTILNTGNPHEITDQCLATGIHYRSRWEPVSAQQKNIVSARLLKENRECASYSPGEKLQIEFQLGDLGQMPRPRLDLAVCSTVGTKLFTLSSGSQTEKIGLNDSTTGKLTVQTEPLPLLPGAYDVHLSLFSEEKLLWKEEAVLKFEVTQQLSAVSQPDSLQDGVMLIPHHWKYSNS